MAKSRKMVDEHSPNSNRMSAEYPLPTFSSLPDHEPAEPTEKEQKKCKSKPPFAGDFALEMNGGEPKKSSKRRSMEEQSYKSEENLSLTKDRFSPETHERRSKSGSPKPGCSFNQDGDSSSSRSPRSSEDNQDELSSILSSPTSYPKTSSTVRKLRLENERLQAEVTRLRRLVISGATTILSDKTTPTESAQDPSGKVYTLEVELQLAKEALLTLKFDRRRLKAEKYDLLNQMKGLYGTLDEREKELRDFIRNYKSKMSDTDNSVLQLSTEREERERERWSLLRHARDEAERSLSLAARLSAKEIQLQIAQEQLQETRRQLASSGCTSDQESVISLPRYGMNGGAITPGSRIIPQDLNFISDRGSCSADSGLRMSSDKESRTTSIGGNLSDSTTDGASALLEEEKRDLVSMAALSTLSPPHHIYQSISARNSSPTPFPMSSNNLSRQIDPSILSRSVEHLSSPVELETIDINKSRPKLLRPSNRGGTWGSISRVFARSRHKNKSESAEGDISFKQFRSWSPLTEESYAEKLCLLKEASTVPMERWKSPIVMAWLQVALGMPQYCARYSENIKSGKIAPLNGQDLLELSDFELECTLGITHPLHRKKLRLAIEEHRHPHLLRYPAMAQLGQTWVSSEWLQDLGLSQYSENFAVNMVDARMLEHLSKKELEKYLGVTRKFHQASIVHGIHLLRIMKYNRQTLTVRRHQCETIDADPLVWTNQRFIRWARSIDLGEYADNLKGSGVHGGLVVLEPSFNGDTMATALGIPASKNSIRRLLVAELEALVLPARSVLEQYVQLRNRSRVLGGSLGRTYSRSCAGLTAPHPLTYKDQQISETRRSTIRGSISRALGLKKSKQEREKHSPTSSSESSSVRSRVSPTYFYKSSRSGEESPVYATPFATQHSSLHYNRRSAEEKEMTGAVDAYNGDNQNIFDSFIPRAHKNKNKHRRVRSINEIESVPNEPT